MYYPTIPFDDIPRDDSFSEWFESIHQRLEKWYQTTHQSINLAEKIEFHELLFQCQILRLNRPSPRRPAPTQEMRKRALQASIAVLKELGLIDRMGKLFNIWHASYFLLEAAICILGIILTGIESQRATLTTLEGEDIPIICRYIPTAPILLKKISRRWPSMAVRASALEALSQEVIEKLHTSSKSETMEDHGLETLKIQLNQFSPFPPLPPEGESSVANPLSSITSEPTIALADMVVPPSIQRPFDQTVLQIPSVDAAPTGDQTFSQSIMDHNLSILPDSYDFDGDANLLWDFDGLDTEEILAAFA